jgi:predicted small lipoprotein YifL
MKDVGKLATAILLTVSLAACGKGEPINAPQFKPPVDAATPGGLKVSGAVGGARRVSISARGGFIEGDQRSVFNLPDLCDPTNTDYDETACMLDNLKTNVFGTNGPTFLNDLETIDRRMAELDERAQETSRKCLGEDTKAWTASLVKNETFPMHFSCRENMGSHLQVFFGKKDRNFYLGEMQDASKHNGEGDAFNGSIIARASEDGQEVESWKLSVAEDEIGTTVVYLHVKANRETSEMELRTASNNTGLAEGCGVHLRSDGQNIKVDFWKKLELSQGNWTCDADPTRSCLGAATLEETGDQTLCDSIDFEFSPITRADIGLNMNKSGEGYEKAIDVLKTKGMPSLTRFND